MQDFLIETRTLARSTIVFVTHDIDEAVFVGGCIFIASPRPLLLTSQFQVPFSLMPRTDFPLMESLDVLAGERVRFRCSARARSDIGEAVFMVEKIDRSKDGDA